MDETVFTAMNTLPNPIFLTDPEGKILYKNRAAFSLCPPLYRSICGRLFAKDAALLGSDLDKSAFPRFVPFNDRGDAQTAFVDTVYYERRLTLLWVTSPLFRSALAESVFLPEKEGREVLSGETLAFRIGKMAKAQEGGAPEANAKSRYMTFLLYKLTALTVDAVVLDRAVKRCPLSRALQVFYHICHQILRPMGAELLPAPLPEDANLLEVALYPFLLFSSAKLLWTVECSESPIVRSSALLEDEQVYLTFSAGKKPTARRLAGGDRSFSSLLPSEVCDLYFFHHGVKNSGCHFDFVFDDKPSDNLRLCLRTPLKLPTAIRADSALDYTALLSLITQWAKDLLAASAPQEE